MERFSRDRDSAVVCDCDRIIKSFAIIVLHFVFTEFVSFACGVTAARKEVDRLPSTVGRTLSFRRKLPKADAVVLPPSERENLNCELL